MKVKCIKLIDKTTKQLVQKNDWLTAGKIYDVVFVEEPVNEPKRYRVVSDDISNKPMLYEADFFEVIGVEKDNWVTETTANGTTRKGPEEMMTPGFWGNVFEGEPKENGILNNYLSSLEG